MSKERMVNTQFWDDPYTLSLSTEDKCLYIYFFTNALANIAGIYEITVNHIAFHTGLGMDVINSKLAKFEADKKIFYSNGWLVVCNMPKHQKWQTKTTIKDGIDKIIKALPEWLVDLLRTSQIPYTYSMDLVDWEGKPNPSSSGPEAKRLLDYYFNKFQTKFNEKLVIDGARDMAILKKLLSEHTEDRLISLIDLFFEIDDEWIKKAGYGINIFKVSVNKLLTYNKDNSGSEKTNDRLDYYLRRAEA